MRPLAQQVEVDSRSVLGSFRAGTWDGRRSEKGDDPLERNSDPTGPVVQLVEQLIEGLVEQ